MANKLHCDRCDIWLGEGEGHWPQHSHDLSHTFLADKGQGVDSPALLRLKVTITQNGGDGEEAVTLCDDCLEDAIDAFAHYRLTRREARRLQAAKAVRS